MNFLSWHEFPNPETLAEKLSDYVARALRTRLAADGQAALAVAGGSTPVRFFQLLSAHELDWAKVTITLTDDRWVPETSPRSNAKLVRTHLLQRLAAAATFLPLVTDDETPEAGEAAVETRIAALHLPFAAVVLGMGTDGHTASFFPPEDHAAAHPGPAPGRLVWVEHKEAAREPRISLTFPVLLAADTVAVHIEGETKRAVLDRALQDGPALDMPIRTVLNHAPRPDVFWCP